MVKSAYHMHKERELLDLAGGSAQRNTEEVWKNIWGMRSPNAERISFGVHVMIFCPPVRSFL
jgi:hypothetical protein